MVASYILIPPLPLDILYVYVYYIYMPNKTIYVSDKDEKIFEQAQKLGNDALSAVIVRAIKEFVARSQKQKDGMSEIKVEVGTDPMMREQRFVGREMAKWQGTSDDKVWWMESKVYKTQKGNWAILLTTVAKAELLLHGARNWMDWAQDPKQSELIVAVEVNELQAKLPSALYSILKALADKNDQPVEYLDI
jgi:EXLDI family protein